DGRKNQAFGLTVHDRVASSGKALNICSGANARRSAARTLGPSERPAREAERFPWCVAADSLRRHTLAEFPREAERAAFPQKKSDSQPMRRPVTLPKVPVAAGRDAAIPRPARLRYP